MDKAEIIDISRRAIEVLLIISLPFLIGSLAIGILVSLLQTLTNIQEATISFVPKIILVFILLLIFGPLISTTLTDFINELISKIPEVK